MAKEYGELEQLVNDVTSLDTARMTLRWALERLNTIEKEKADLKKNLTLAEETSKRLQVKDSSLQDAYSSRSKTLEEKEDFYTKLEATMSLLGEGKLDIQQLLKKEAKLDTLRKSLETEYSEKFEDLDRSQRSIIERWNTRLLDVEGQYAGRLAEAQKKYDSLRTELEAEHQVRLTELQASFKRKEGELSGRIAFLETNVRQSEGKVETRRAELEAEYMAKKREMEENFRKRSNMLETGLESKLRAMDSDHAAQITSLEASWQAERGRLLEEQRVREDQFLAAQSRIKEIENNLASQQDGHHSELLKMIAEKETAFRSRLTELEAEKSAKEEHVRELTSSLEKRAAGWAKERAGLQADFERRAASMEAALKEREAAFENDYAAKKEDIYKAASVKNEALAKELEARLADEKRAMNAERARMEEDRARMESALVAASNKITELENTLSSAREDGQKELLGRIGASEASFREKLAVFEGERQAYHRKISTLADELRAKETAFEQRAAAMEAEYSVRRDNFEKEHEEAVAAVRRDAQVKFESERAIWAAERERFEKTLKEFSEKFSDAQVEMVKLNSDLRNAAEAAAAREASATVELMGAKAVFEKELSGRLKEAVQAHTASLVEALEVMKAERADLSASLVKKEEEISSIKEESARSRAEVETRLFSEYSQSLETQRVEIANSFSARKSALEADFAQRRGALEKEASLNIARLTDALETMKSEKAGLFILLAGKEDEIGNLKQEAARSRSEVETRLLAEYSASLEAQRVEMFNAYAERKAALEQDFSQRRAALENETSLKVEQLAELLDVMKAEKTDLTVLIEQKDGEIKVLKETALRSEAEMETKMFAECSKEVAVRQEELARAFASRHEEIEKAFASRQAALEADYRQREASMGKDFALRSSRIEEENASLKTAFEKLNVTAASASSRAAELSEKLLAAEKSFHAEKLEMQKAYVKEIDYTVSSAVDAAVEVSEQKLARAQEELSAARKKAAELSEKLLAAENAHSEEKIELKKEQIRGMNASVSEAVAEAVAEYEQRLARMQEELAKTKKEAREQERLLEDIIAEEKTSVQADLAKEKKEANEQISQMREIFYSEKAAAQAELAKAKKEANEEIKQIHELFAAEKTRLQEEVGRRDNYIESMELKMQEQEHEMLKYRQEASSELMRNISDQDARFREAAAEEKARNEARIRQLEELVSAKEKLLSDSDKFYRQKQLELDGVHTSLNMRVNEFNEEIFAQKQAISDKEKNLNDYRLKLEEENARTMSELEAMKTELSRAIREYKSRK